GRGGILVKIRKGDGDMYPLRVINPKWGDKEWTPSEEDWWRDHIAGVDVVATRGDGTCVGCFYFDPEREVSCPSTRCEPDCRHGNRSDGRRIIWVRPDARGRI
ncbi:MAG TPA: hypothetical protein PLG04_06640, partial [Anaerolineaceae bacterium]|nr:hypothetical protein [Anaerolineaceae bacterium]